MTDHLFDEFAERYDGDPRLAFLEVGFGLWAEYHIYSGPEVLGQTFPSMEFQANYFQHLDRVFAQDRKSTRLNSSHMSESRMPSSA